jgi:hypothetical protein
MERAGDLRTETNHAVGAALDETDSMLGNSCEGRALTPGIVSGEHPRIERSHHQHYFSRAGAGWMSDPEAVFRQLCRST